MALLMRVYIKEQISALCILRYKKGTRFTFKICMDPWPRQISDVKTCSYIFTLTCLATGSNFIGLQRITFKRMTQETIGVVGYRTLATELSLKYN